VSEPALDPAVIESLRQLTGEGEPEVVREVLTLFRDGAPARIAAIRRACLAGEAGALQRTAHEFKGASATIGAFPLQRCCRALEMAGKSARLDDAPALLEALDAEWTRVDAAIADALRSYGMIDRC
jgi:HPt (histidine-containing phosphotransfer) domain-containing protein